MFLPVQSGASVARLYSLRLQTLTPPQRDLSNAQFTLRNAPGRRQLTSTAHSSHATRVTESAVNLHRMNSVSSK